ncbi:MAG: hypothetical protein J6U58_04970 [Bacteroidaceae bacterium]|nr:hypothetical protein [Bacteroidaceae bacterium]
MNKENILKSLRINYTVAFVATLIIIAAFECGFIEKGALANIISSTMFYALQVVVIMLTVILIPIAIKGFTNSMTKVKDMDSDNALKLYCKKSLQRIFLLFIVIVINEFAYYGMGYEGSLYCGLFGFGSMIYSFPTKMVMEEFLQGKTEK